jgi:phosphorylase kinase alpha/beta subunit
MAAFSAERTLEIMESLQRPSGAFVAAPTPDYQAFWLRDHLYVVFSYYFLGEYEKLKRGMGVAFDFFRKHRYKLERVNFPEDPAKSYEYLNAKVHPDTFEEITRQWGHHQLDAIGLFLYIVSDLKFKNIDVRRDDTDSEILQLLAFYLENVRYFERPDFGMWEDSFELHSSSLGACVAALEYGKRERLITVPEELISLGKDTLDRILPRESASRECDLAQLSLIWPYHIVKNEMAEKILENAQTKLVQKHGLNRYWGDNWPRRSKNGISPEWVFGFDWLAIIYAQRHEMDKARHWFDLSTAQMVDGKIPELYVDDEPNEHTPLAWAHALKLVAWAKIFK